MGTESEYPAVDSVVQTLTLPITAAQVVYNNVSNQKVLRLTFTAGGSVDVLCRQ